MGQNSFRNVERNNNVHTVQKDKATHIMLNTIKADKLVIKKTWLQDYRNYFFGILGLCTMILSTITFSSKP